MAEYTVAMMVFIIAGTAVIPLVGVVRKLALDRGHLDIPNKRSSHFRPTPSGGGVAILFCWSIIVILLWLIDLVPSSIILAIGPPALAIAAVGFVDDRVNLSSRLRLVIQFISVAWFIHFSEHLSLIVLFGLVDGSYIANLAIAFSLLWLINLFNFMDGIDGIAGSEAAFVFLSIGLLSGVIGNVSLMLLSLSLAGACVGFLWWNWPPAKIFLGDVGSAPLGFLIGALGLTVVDLSNSTSLVLVILLGVFLIDATVTLVTRIVSGQRWYSAHRTHAYQKLAIRWTGHRRVTLAVCLINICWLFPLAAGAYYLPDYSGIITFVELVPLVMVALILGAGCADTFTSTNTIEK